MASKFRVPALLAAAAAVTLALAGCSNAVEVDPLERDEQPQADQTDTNDQPTPDEPDEPEETFVAPEDSSVFAVSVGDCITNADMLDTEVQSVPTVPCSQPHTYEVYHDFELTTTEFPGQGTDELFEAVYEGCIGDSYESFVGVPYEQSVYEVLYLSPTQASWDQGDRLVSCMIYEPDASGSALGDVTEGSLEGANK